MVFGAQFGRGSDLNDRGFIGFVGPVAQSSGSRVTCSEPFCMTVANGLQPALHHLVDVPAHRLAEFGMINRASLAVIALGLLTTGCNNLRSEAKTRLHNPLESDPARYIASLKTGICHRHGIRMKQRRTERPYWPGPI